MVHNKAPHRPWEPDAGPPCAVRGSLDPRAGNALGYLRDAHRRAPRKPPARGRRPHPPRSQARAARGPHGHGAHELAVGQARWSVTIARDGKTVTLSGEALVRWKYQRYMKDYLATIQSVDDNVGRLLAFLDAERAREEHHRHLHERPGLLSRRPRHVRQALHVRRVAAHAVPDPLAGGHQGGNTKRRDRR